MDLYWVGGLSPTRGPAASETHTGRVADDKINCKEESNPQEHPHQITQITQIKKHQREMSQG
jgi:hypothetical protein